MQTTSELLNEILQQRRVEVTKRFLSHDSFGETIDGIRSTNKTISKQYAALTNKYNFKKKQRAEFDAAIDDLEISEHTWKDIDSIEVHLLDAIDWLLHFDSMINLEKHLQSLKFADNDIQFISLERAAIITHWLEAIEFEPTAEPTLSEYIPSIDKTGSHCNSWTKHLQICAITQYYVLQALKGLKSQDSMLYHYLFEGVLLKVAKTEFSHLPSIEIRREVIDLEPHTFIYENNGQIVEIGQLPNKQNWEVNTDLLQSNGNYVKRKPQYRLLHKFENVTSQSTTFADICCGVGGFRIAFQKWGYRCIFSSDINPKSKETYFRNYGVVPFDDITRFTTTNALPSPVPDNDDFSPESLLPDFKVMTGGFPCQPFSRAGLQLGTEDARGNLFYNICEIAKVKSVHSLILENVPGITSVDKDDPGKTLNDLKDTLFDIGYPKVHIYKINAREFGVPQKRVRLFFIATHKEFSDKRTIPKCEGDAQPVLGDVTINVKGLNEAFCLSQFLTFSHWLRAKKNSLNGKGFGFDVVDPKQKATVTLTTRYYKDALECCVISDESCWGNDNSIANWLALEERFNQWHGQSDKPRSTSAEELLQLAQTTPDALKKMPSPLRFLTPRETARCFGFPDWFSLSRSNTAAHFQFGNSIAVPIAEDIARRLSDTDTDELKVLYTSPSLEKFLFGSLFDLDDGTLTDLKEY